MSSEYERFLTPKQRDLIGWFSRNASGLGKLYEGCLRMLDSKSFPGRVRFVAHAVREIRNRLPDVIAGPQSGGRLDYKNRLDEVVSLWKEHGLPMDGSAPLTVSTEDEVPPDTQMTDVSIPICLYRKIASLIQDHDRSREKPYEAAKRLFQAIDSRNRDAEYLLRPRIEHWLSVTKWFVDHVHKWNLDDEGIDARELRHRFRVFESTLMALVRGFFETTEELDEILEEANS